MMDVFVSDIENQIEESSLTPDKENLMIKRLNDAIEIRHKINNEYYEN